MNRHEGFIGKGCRVNRMNNIPYRARFAHGFKVEGERENPKSSFSGRQGNCCDCFINVNILALIRPVGSFRKSRLWALEQLKGYADV